MNYFKNFLISVILIQFIISLSSAIEYCLEQSSDGATCLTCQDGYILKSSTICQADCLDLFYLNSDKECSTLCSLSQMGNDATKTCEQINLCPNSYSIGQSFHSGSVNNLLINTDTNELVTSSGDDTHILVWDSSSGEQLAGFQGHTVAPLKMFFQTQAAIDENSDVTTSSSTILLSFSVSEVIIWNYNQATIKSLNIISNGQITRKSKIDENRTYITTFGYQGEFFLVNYLTLSSLKYIGHSNIVDTVLFLGNDFLISSAKDKQILLWNILDLNQPLPLFSMFVSKMTIKTLSVASKQSQYLFVLGGTNNDENTTIVICYLDITQKLSDIVANFQLIHQSLNDHTSPIIDFIVDKANLQLISYSANEMIVYSSQSQGTYISFTLKEKVNLPLILKKTDFKITSCSLFDTNKFVIGTSNNQVFFFSYSSSSTSNTLTPTTSSNSITIHKQSISDTVFSFKYFISKGSVFIYSSQVISVNFSSLKIDYIITNFITPPIIQHTSKVLEIEYSISRQIIATISSDYKLLIYDYITEELLTVIQNPNNLNASATQAFISPVKVVIILNIVCVSYDDKSLICYNPISGEIVYQYTGAPEILVKLITDPSKNYLLASGQSVLIVFDLGSFTIYSQLSASNQFYVINFQPTLNQIFASSTFGNYTIINYPLLAISLQQDYTSSNVHSQTIKGWKFDSTFKIGVTYYSAGLVILLNSDLSLIKSFNNTLIPLSCDIVSSQAICVNTNGNLTIWNISTSDSQNINIANNPVLKSHISQTSKKEFMLIDYSAYGTGILAGNLEIMFEGEIFTTSRFISNFAIDDTRTRLLAIMNNGDVSDYHFTAQPSSLLSWQGQQQSQVISKIISYQEKYKLIILCIDVTVYDYLSSSIYKVGKFHNQIVTNATVDTARDLIISYNQATTQNLFVWDFEKDIKVELIGHTNGITGVLIFSSTDGSLISYSLDGQIIIWNYLKGTITKQLNLYQGSQVLQVFVVLAKYSTGSQKQSMISLGGNKVVSIYDFSSGEITSQISLTSTGSRLVLDTTYQRIFAYYQNSIQVYSYLTGLKITELLDFDGNIGPDIQFQPDAIIAHGQLVISSFNRDTLNILYSSKSTQAIFQTAIIGSYVGLISDSLNDIIKLWNYQTGAMLQDLTNEQFPIALNGIQADPGSQNFLVKNIKNNIFTFNPYSSSLSKLTNKLIYPSFSSQLIKEIVLDQQSNLLFTYNDNQIMQWKYFTFLGQKGQEQAIPSNPQIFLAYHSQKDIIFYADMEQNVWSLQSNQLISSGILQSRALQCIVVGDILIIREQASIKSYSVNKFEVVSELKLFASQLIYAQEETGFIFVITVDQKVIKVSLDQSQKTMQQMITYNFPSGIANRWFLSKINSQYQHLILSSITGQIIVCNYSTDQTVATLSDHSQSITRLFFDNNNNKLFTSSLDKKIVIYSYNDHSVTLKSNLIMNNSVEEIVFDPQYSRLLCWVNLQTVIYILDSSDLTSNHMNVLAPGDVYIQINISFDFDKYAIFNKFQVNIYERKDIFYLTSIRFPSDLQDIKDAIFLDSYNILIISHSSLRVYSFAQSSNSLVTSLSMTGAQLVYYDYEIDNRQLSLKGVNYETAFNYTYILFSSGASSTAAAPLSIDTCYQNIKNPRHYFQLRQSIQLQETGFSNFGLSSSISSVKYNLLFTTGEASYINISFPQLSSSIIYNKIVLFTSEQNNLGFPRMLSGQQNRESNYEVEGQLSLQRSLSQVNEDLSSRVAVMLGKAQTEFFLPSLILNNFYLPVTYFTSSIQFYPVTFNSATTNFNWKDGIIAGINLHAPACLAGLHFQNITSLVLEQFILKDIVFDGTQTSTYQNYLFEIFNATSVTIKYLQLSNLTITNQGIIQINDVANVIIQEVDITNISFITSGSFNASVFNIINCKTVTIDSINIANIASHSNFNLLQLQGNEMTAISNLSGKILSNCRLLYYLQYYDQDDFQYKVKNDEISLDSIILTDITSSLSQLEIESQNISLNAINATKVICDECYGTIIKATSTQFTLNNSIFQSNKAFQGGAIQLALCITTCQISNSIILSNQAVNGGGIYLDNSEIQFEKTTIELNTAYIGGGIRYKDNIPLQILNKTWKDKGNSIKNNVAKVFGNNFGSFPRTITLQFGSNNSTSYLFKNSSSFEESALNYMVSGFMSGDNFIFSLNLNDEEDRVLTIQSEGFSSYPSVIQDELSNYQIQCYSDNDLIQLNSETLISLNEFDSKTNTFVFDKLVISAQPESTNHFYLKTNAIYLPSAKVPQTFFQPSFSVYLNLYFRTCRRGEIYVAQSAGQLEHCKKCAEGMYSLVEPEKDNLSISCKVCPKEALRCQESEIILKNGYWRENNTTDLIVECTNAKQNCQGESSINRNYCGQGFIGPLCEICDSSGVLWGASFSKVGRYQCKQCGQMIGQYVVYSISYIIIISYVCIGIKQGNKVSQRKILGYYLRMMGLISIGSSDSADQTSVYMKFLMHYLYISSIVKGMNISFPYYFDLFQTQISSPVDSMKYSPDCYQAYLFSLRPVYSRQVISQILPFIYMATTFVIYLTLVFFKKLRHSNNYIFSGLVFLFIFIQPDLISGVISTSSCRTIANQKYVTDDIAEVCFTIEHVKFMIYFCLPCFLLWAITFPILLLYNIFKNKNQLNFLKARVRFGFIYQEYKFKIFYWEFIKMGLKLIVTLLDNFFRDQQVTKAATASTFIFFYLLLALKLKPFESREFNKCDRVSHSLLIVILQLSSITTINDINWLTTMASLLFYSLHYTFIIYLIGMIFKSKLQWIFIFLSTKFPSLKTKYPQVYQILHVRQTYNPQTFKNWRKVWAHIFKQKDFFVKLQLKKTAETNPPLTQDRNSLRLSIQKASETTWLNQNQESKAFTPEKKLQKKYQQDDQLIGNNDNTSTIRDSTFRDISQIHDKSERNELEESQKDLKWITPEEQQSQEIITKLPQFDKIQTVQKMNFYQNQNYQGSRINKQF